MNDYWNDPPDYPEVPGCPHCDDQALDYCEQGVLICAICGYKVAYDLDWSELDVDPWAEEKPHGEAHRPEKCPHGNEWGHCDKCDHEGDIAYDAARERRFH
jgi:hypothetical protein